MQEGSVIREQRKLGPDVWCYRWWESGPTGNRVHRRIVLGTAEELRDMSTARQMTAGLMQEINATDIRMARMSLTMAQLSDHFQQRSPEDLQRSGQHNERGAESLAVMVQLLAGHDLSHLQQISRYIRALESRG